MQAILLIIAVLTVDQLSKIAIRQFLAEGDSIPVLGSFFQLTHYENDGAAFSTMSGQRALLILFPVVVVMGGAWFLWKHYRSSSRFLCLSVAAIIGGGLGNLIDRALFGQVTDMLSFRIFPPIFNVADAAVVIGCFLLVICVLREEGHHE